MTKNKQTAIDAFKAIQETYLEDKEGYIEITFQYKAKDKLTYNFSIMLDEGNVSFLVESTEKIKWFGMLAEHVSKMNDESIIDRVEHFAWKTTLLGRLIDKGE